MCGGVGLTFREHREPEYPPPQAHTLGRTQRLPYRHVCWQRAGGKHSRTSGGRPCGRGRVDVPHTHGSDRACPASRGRSGRRWPPRTRLRLNTSAGSWLGDRGQRSAAATGFSQTFLVLRLTEDHQGRPHKTENSPELMAALPPPLEMVT